jgi:hypothetical protein
LSPGEYSLDLPQFNAKTADLHLVIDAAKELDITTWQITG